MRNSHENHGPAEFSRIGESWSTKVIAAEQAKDRQGRRNDLLQHCGHPATMLEEGQTQGSGHPATPLETGKARDNAARAVGLGSGSRAEKALKALQAADQLELIGEAEKAAAIKTALNKQGLAAGVREAQKAAAQPPPKPVTPPDPPAASPVPKSTTKSPPATKLVNSSSRIEKKSNVIDGKRHRSKSKCREMPEFASELAYLKAEIPKLQKLITSTEAKLRKISDHYRDGYTKDRYYADFFTVWSVAWKEDESFDYAAEVEKIKVCIGMMQGALTGLLRVTQSEDVRIDP